MPWAACAALLLLLCCWCPAAAVPCQALFKVITSLSYLGDVRMGLAEDSKKVERIVAGSYSHFRSLYLPLLKVGVSAVMVSDAICALHRLLVAGMVEDCWPPGLQLFDLQRPTWGRCHSVLSAVGV